MSSYNESDSYGSSSSSDDESYRERAGYEKIEEDTTELSPSSSGSEVAHIEIAGSDRSKDHSLDRKINRYYHGTHEKFRRSIKKQYEEPKTESEQDDSTGYPLQMPSSVIIPIPEPDEDDDEDGPSNNQFTYIILGYITGIFLVLGWYFMFFHAFLHEINSVWLFFVLVALFMLLLSYNIDTTCIGVLLLPFLVGFKGQLLVILLAMYFAVSGPVRNIMHNINKMSRCIVCGQELLKQALTPMHEFMGDPIFVVEHSIYVCLTKVRRLMERLNRFLLRLEQPIDKLHDGYKSCAAWLELQQHFFENQMGVPYDRCMGAGTIGIQECQSKFGKDNCKLDSQFDWFCSNLKQLSSFFDTHMQQQLEIADKIFIRPKETFDKIRTMFEVTIVFDHYDKAKDDVGKGISELGQKVARHMDIEMHKYLTIFMWLHAITLILVVLVILGAINFRYNYLGSDNYRNIYLNSEFYEFDTQQNTNLGYSSLPLRPTEQKKYIKITSLRQLPAERRIMRRSFVFMIIVCLQLFTICFLDYSLYWLLAIMSYHTHQIAALQPYEYTKIVVKNGGVIGFVLHGFIDAFEPLSKNLIIDIEQCSPVPAPPKRKRYWEISMVCLFAWFLVLCEAYALRVRHPVMTNFYPDEGCRRAVYLYRHLLHDREVFIMAARRRARSLDLYVQENWLYKMNRWYKLTLFWASCGYFGSYNGQNCIVCDSALTKLEYLGCDTPGCRGVYCQTCFIESNCHCILCNPPTAYGDYDDYSEVEDSSDDPDSQPFRPNRIYCESDSIPIARRHKSA